MHPGVQGPGALFINSVRSRKAKPSVRESSENGSRLSTASLPCTVLLCIGALFRFERELAGERATLRNFENAAPCARLL